MSKSLKKLIDINRLREFKNKLVGTDSPYVQTGAVDQTVAGTKAFSEPIVGSVTGSSGSCTGNAATATTATTAKACTGNAATATKLATARSLWGNNFDGSAAITGIITGTPGIEFKPGGTTANYGGVLDFHYNNSTADYTSRIIESASGTLSINDVTITTEKVVTAATFNGALKGNVTGNCSGTSGGLLTNTTFANSSFTYTEGQVAIGTTAGKAFKGSSNNAALVSFPENGTASNNRTANIQNLRLTWQSDGKYLHDLFTSPNSRYFWHRDVNNASASPWRRIVEENTTDVTPPTWDISIGGNAATATKLAAKCTIALSGAATGTATGFDGSDNITIPVTALSPSAIRAQWYAAYPDGPEAHNAMWGGRDITAAFDSGEFSEHIADGTFKDIFPGDYITKQVTISGTAYTVNWVVADCDYWINKGDTTATTVHHVVIVPQVPIFNTNMNDTNTTEGGYAGSRMYRETIPACATGIVNAFGSSHILTFRDGITNSVDTSHVSSGIPQLTGTPVWWGEMVSVQCNLMSEKMVYGAPICAAGAMDNAMATRQMSAFRLSERLINYNRDTWWLRDVVSSAYFAFVNGSGYADANSASHMRGVRPFALLV